MTNNLIITIGRQCGSGGKMIGELLAEKMGVKCYDKELLSMAAKHSGLCEELFEKHDERPTSSFLYSLVMDSYSMGYTASGYSDMPINHKIFLAQFDTIKKLAEEASCVMVGRCADYALEDYPNVVSVFITANDDDKIKLIESGAGKQLIFMRFRNPVAGIWKVRVYNTQYFTGEFHMWLPSEGLVSDETVFLRPTPDTTITLPGNTAAPITVGAYNHLNNSFLY